MDKKSADNNYADAQNELGRMYRDGLGVKKNLREAKNWYQKSAAQGNESAKNSYDELSVVSDKKGINIPFKKYKSSSSEK